MKTNNQIVSELYADAKYFDSIKRITRGDILTEDLWQEVLLIILEYDNVKLNKIIEAGYFNFFFIRIVTNQYKSDSSPFYKKYKREELEMLDSGSDSERMEWDDGKEIALDDNEIELPEDLADETYSEEVDRQYNLIKGELYWYDAELFELYIKLGSYRKVAKETGIPLGSVADSLKSSKEYIQKRIKEVNKKNNSYEVK